MTPVKRAAFGVVIVSLVAFSTQLAAQTKQAAEKIPITTSSDEARTLYLKGRDLAEKLRATDARRLYEQAVAKDPNFALGYVGPGEHLRHQQRVRRCDDARGGAGGESQRRRAPHGARARSRTEG